MTISYEPLTVKDVGRKVRKDLCAAQCVHRQRPRWAGKRGYSFLLWASITRAIEHWISLEQEEGPLMERTWRVREALRKKSFRDDG